MLTLWWMKSWGQTNNIIICKIQILQIYVVRVRVVKTSDDAVVLWQSPNNEIVYQYWDSTRREEDNICKSAHIRFTNPQHFTLNITVKTRYSMELIFQGHIFRTNSFTPFTEYAKYEVDHINSKNMTLNGVWTSLD